MSTRKCAVLFAGAGLAFGLAACGTHSNSGGAAGATGAPTAATSAPATAATSAPATAPAPVKATIGKPCPVTEADLRAAVTVKTDNGVSSKSRFTKIACYRNYAVATVPESSRSDEQYAVFKYDSAGWGLVTVASGDICQGVPADVVKRFRSAHYGACG